MRNLRAVQVFNRYLHAGGEEKSVDRIRRHLRDRGMTVETCFFESQSWCDEGLAGKLTQPLRLFFNPGSARALEEAIDQHEPDFLLFHNLYPVGSPALYRVAAKRDIPVIQFIHNFRPFSVSGSLWIDGRNQRGPLRGHYLREIKAGTWQNSRLRTALFATMLKGLHASGWLRSVEGWVAISEFMRERFLDAGLDPASVLALRHSWDAASVPPVPRDEGYYLFLSRLVPEKGVRTLLDAWAILEARWGESTPPLLIGGDGEMKEQVIEAAEKSPAVRYLGFVDGEEKETLIKGCRAMLAPSVWWEPLGLVTYEAYDRAKPMLAAASGGLTETVIDGETGWLHQPGEPESLANSVRQHESTAPHRREAMGRRGREWLLRNTSVAEWGTRFEAFVREILEARESPAKDMAKADPVRASSLDPVKGRS